MNNNKIEELKERLEELHRIQEARLACNADDLDIREEIAEAEDEIKELQDDINEENNNGNDINVGSIGNSIEEDIKCVQDFLEYSQDMINDMDYERPVDVTIYQQQINSMQHILSDYKRVLKENEELKNKDIIIVDNLIHKLDKKNEVLQELLKERGKIICIKNGE